MSKITLTSNKKLSMTSEICTQCALTCIWITCINRNKFLSIRVDYNKSCKFSLSVWYFVVLLQIMVLPITKFGKSSANQKSHPWYLLSGKFTPISLLIENRRNFRPNHIESSLSIFESFPRTSNLRSQQAELQHVWPPSSLFFSTSESARITRYFAVREEAKTRQADLWSLLKWKGANENNAFRLSLASQIKTTKASLGLTFG